MRRLLIAFLLVLTVAVVGLAVFLVVTQEPLDLPVSQTVLGSFLYEDPEHVFFTDDGERVARVKSVPGGERVLLDGQPGPLFVRVSSLTFSPDGQHIAYVAKREGRFLVVADGKAGPVYDDIVRPPLYSPAGGRVAYVARLGREQFLVLDGKQGQAYHTVWCSDDAFSPSGDHIVTVVNEAGRDAVAVDGEPFAWHDGVAWALFSPRGEIAYARVDKGESHLVVGTDVGPPFDEITVPSFSPDGSRVAYRAKQNGRRLVVIDGVVGPAYDGVTRPIFSPDGQRVVYVAEQGSEQFVVEGGEAGVRYYRIRDVYFRPNGHLAFIARFEGSDALIVDGLAGPQFDQIDAVRLGPQARRVAYIAHSKKRKHMVVDQQPGPACDAVSPARFSPDGAHVAYVATEGERRRVVVDGHPGPPFDGVLWGPLRVSREGLRAVYTDATGKRWLLRFGSPIDVLYRGQALDVPRFADDGTIEYLARRDTTLLLVQQPFTSGKE